MDFSGQRAVITGGSSGIGLATARAFVELGGKVSIIGRDPGRLRRAAEILGDAAETCSADVTSETALADLFARLGDFDHLVTAAGPMPDDGPLLSVDMGSARRLFEGKFWSQFLTMRHAVPRLRPGGSITLIGGSLARKAMPGAPVFGAIDGALESLCRIVALEISPLRVNLVAPGIIDTPMLDAFSAEVRAKTLEGFARRTLVGRHGQAEDVAKTILFLMDNTFVSGTVIDTDGGMK